MPKSKTKCGSLPIPLWVELHPIVGHRPNEFKTNAGYNGEILKVRHWSFINMEGVDDVVYEEIAYRNKIIKVAKIGNYQGNLPTIKCWWLSLIGPCMSQIQEIQLFGTNLNTTSYPPVANMQRIKFILENWIDKYTDSEDSIKLHEISAHLRTKDDNSLTGKSLVLSNEYSHIKNISILVGNSKRKRKLLPSPAACSSVQTRREHTELNYSISGSNHAQTSMQISSIDFPDITVQTESIHFHKHGSDAPQLQIKLKSNGNIVFVNF